MKQTNQLNRKRFLSLLLTLVLMASVFTMPTVKAESITDQPGTAAASTASSAIPERIRDGVILHAFDWNLSVIEENLQAIADAGYTAIQTSPIMGSASGTNWYFAYQPSNMLAGGKGNRYGDRDAFVSLTTAAKALGIKVIVDVVPNHMGSTGNSDAPWNDNTYFHNVSGSVGYNDRFLLTQPNMISGLRDLNTHSKFVQDSYIAYLKDMIDAGASGFRYDAIKHIELDDDMPSPASIAAGLPEGEFKSDYVKNVTGAAKAYFKEKGKENFQYGEVLQGGDPQNDRMKGYAKYIDMTASKYGHDVRGVLEVGDIGRLDKWADYAAEGLTADRLVPWVESHDTYNNEGESLSFSPKQVRQGWAIIAARKDASPLFFARNVNADGSQRTSVLTADNVDNNRSQWSHPEVVAVNKFHNAMAGRDENLVSLGNNAVMIERGTTADGGGAVLLNTSTTDRVLGSVPVRFLKDGFYANALNPANIFTVSNGRISGTLPGNPAKANNTETGSNPGLVVLMEKEVATSTVLAALPSDDDVLAGNSFTGNQLKLRMSAVNVTSASYAINNGDAVSFAHDDIITVNGNYNEPITVTLVGRTADGNWITKAFTYTRVEPVGAVVPPVAEPTHVNVYLSINRNANFQAWGTHTFGVRTYTYNPELFGGWPGGTMTRLKYNGADTHWYKISMPRAAVGGIIFNTQNNSGTGQQTGQPAITASMLNNEQLYFYGTGASGYNINGSTDSGNNARANWDTAFAAGNNIGFVASGVFPPGRNGVIFNTSGGSSVDSQYVREGEKATRPTTDPTRSGYLFDGKWYTDSAFTQEYSFNAPVVNTLGDGHIYAMTLYAGWIQLEADKFLVQFNSQGGSSVMSIPNVAAGSNITAPQQPVRNGYTFAGWYKDSAYNDAWSFGSDTVTAATTLFAKWESVSYAITYKDGGGSAIMPGSEQVTYTYETPTFNLAEPSFKEGYSFNGWYTDSEFLPSSKRSSVAVNSVGHLTLYARFTANAYSITLDPQSGSGGTESISVNYGGKLPLGITRPERDGYSFQGLYANTDGKGQQYYNSSGVRVYEGSWSTASVSNFYAHWILKDDPDIATVAAAVAALEVGYAVGNNAANVTQNVTLPITGLDDVTVSWSSDNPGIIRTDGTVVRPLAGAADATVTLTATLTKGEVTDTKTFTVIVMSIETEAIAVETINISGNDTISTKGGTLQLTAEVLPADATNKAITWSARNGTGSATINESGLLTAVSDGTVTVTATAVDGSGVVGTKSIAISGQTTSNPEPTNPPSHPGPSAPAPTGVIKDGDKAIVELGSGITSKSIPVQDIGGLSLQVKATNAVLTVQADALKRWLTAAGNPSGASIEVIVAPVTVGDIANAPAQGGQARVEVAGVVYDITVKLKHYNQVIDISNVDGGVEITLPYNNETDEDLLGIYYFNEVSKEWEYVGGSIDAAKNTVTVALQHLSKYAVLEYAKSFTDVPSNHWVARTLEVLAAKHIINGTSDTLFTPNGHTTRAEFTSLLVRALGLTNTASSVPFDDVQAGEWYAKEVAIAYEAGLALGVSDNKFDPNAKITREQMAVLLVRAYEYKNGAIAATGQETADRVDGSSISPWAVEGVNKAIAAGLLQGKGNGIFDPASDANRAETAQAILNLFNKK
ncbi:putative repeat protein (TIGR02543 family) [Paenibacillus endophyticus]|uniref:Putative repeat protein (TIGR02543 family) n=1 Tax=Paenibacillus endophyticus TaxID=1294268 RepID=A0A7W5CDC7_9BACL|nr:InlB B-repeat-containing protein [Paenibacillus endophyticus]MBB3155130.1 putative repeat protein (TIGR02543 family) [Paenibacillus endophyticus]